MSLRHRLQILLDDERHERVVAIAQARHVSVATVVREAIDRGLPDTETHRSDAARRLLDASSMEVPDVDELLEELDELRGHRA
ncbi:hypothetical protein CLV30_12435 [Haloactinopolyspora alba]|uniref:Ribbon-helix-helix CopG family protein n=2 Tax=Haloactinopolyspora alba TaxID=648780 RepID=A0A2P8DID8_9ACTN|nr:hypothetical protein [Haloactinopolyspora alba]PSK96951.1 hypothetical protein CLV30_12435 [Haloactinopolyspora alba]